jgi:8-oxo-dGTP diphosphatase
VIEVVAGVLERPDGSFLLAQRPAGKVYAGYWEFPGGKIEPGERAEAALARELDEELGIKVVRAHPWLVRVYTYPHGTVRLNFFRVTQWRGEPHPREDQAIAWQAGVPSAAPMLPANAPVLAALALPHEYAITDAAHMGVARMLERLEQRIAGGLRLVQIREPLLPARERELFTQQAIGIAHRYGCKVLTKEPCAAADGRHFTAVELRQLSQRPAEGMVAASCHTREELQRAIALELDLAVLGPVLEKGAAQPLGWPRFSELVRGSGIPVYAIGGLRREDLETAWRHGAHGVAMIRGSWD